MTSFWQRFILISVLVLILVFFVACVYIIFNPIFFEKLFVKSTYGYSILILIAAFIVALLIVRKRQRIPPSFFLYFMFCAFVILGPIGARIYRNYFGLYHGKYPLTSEYPVFLWSIGTFMLMLGVLVSGSFRMPLRNIYITRWSSSLVTFLLWAMFAIALLGTIYAISKIGYIPVLKGNVDVARADYGRVTGELPIKMWRLWLIVAIYSSLSIYLKQNRKLFVGVTITSLFMLFLFAQRNYMFVGIAVFILIYYKFNKFKIVHLLYIVSMFIAFVFYAEVRHGRSFNKIPLQDIVMMNSAREWREYSIVVNDIRKSRQFYGKDIYIGALAPILPKQIWFAFGVDKEEITRKFGANFIFGRQFGDLIGIRIGTIGEAYAGYGLLFGVCLQMILFGLIIGMLERFYSKLSPLDSRLPIVCFFLALLLLLPITTLYVTTSYGVFYGFILLIFIILGSYRSDSASNKQKAKLSLA